MPFEITGNRGARNSTRASAARRSSAAGSMSGEWNAPLTGSSRARAPQAIGAGGRRVDRHLAPGQDELAGGVVVRDGQLELVRERAHAVLVTAEERDHAPGRELAGARHRPAADGDELHGGVEVERLGRDQRGVLAERVPGGAHRRLLERRRVPGGDAAQQQRGLLQTRALSSCSKGFSPSSSMPRRRRGLSRQGSSMPSAWLPWPGKRTAVGGMGGILADRAGGSRWAPSASARLGPGRRCGVTRRRARSVERQRLIDGASRASVSGVRRET